MSKKNITFNDIARYTNFSKTTISRYFNNPDSLTAKNQETIRQALIDLNYKENKVARILANGSTEFVGVILPNLYLHYFAEMLNQILLTYGEFGYKFLVFVGNERPEVEERYLKELLSYQIEGLIVMSHTLDSAHLASLSLPIVSIEREDACISSVNCDNYMGAVQAVSLLRKHHCEVLIHINTPTPVSVPSYQRLKGFEDFCRDNHLLFETHILDMGHNNASMQKALGDLLSVIEQKYPNQKKGIFFSDDTRANCFLNLLIRRYGKLPADYKLVGFDNSPIAENAVYTISTVGQQIDRIAQEAVSLLHEQIRERREKGPDAPIMPVHKVITPVLYRRDTTEFYSP